MNQESSKTKNGPIRFSGAPVVPHSEIFAEARQRNPAWMTILETAYEDFANLPENKGIYASPKGEGATVEQVWLFFTALGISPYCVLAYPVPEAELRRITRLVKQTPRQLVETLKMIQDVEGDISATTLHYDGRTGHCITVLSYDKSSGRFTYHDPWPLNSLLAAKNNEAGVSAIPKGKNWSVTAPELERVVFASMVFPHSWARLQGVPFDLYFDDWKSSEFFKFFHLKETAQQQEQNTLTRAFAAGRFGRDVELFITSKDSGKIVRAVLLLSTEWMTNNLILALDIAKSFVVAFAPSPDRGKFERVSALLWSLRHPEAALELQRKEPHASPEVECIHAFMGSEESGMVSNDFAQLSFGNAAEGSRIYRKLDFGLL